MQYFLCLELIMRIGGFCRGRTPGGPHMYATHRPRAAGIRNALHRSRAVEDAGPYFFNRKIYIKSQNLLYSLIENYI